MKRYYNLPWPDLQALSTYLYELRREQSDSKALVPADLCKVIEGIAKLNVSSEKGAFNSYTAKSTCIQYLFEYIINAINACNYYSPDPENRIVKSTIIDPKMEWSIINSKGEIMNTYPPKDTLK